MNAPALNYALRETNGELSGNLGWLFTMYHLHCDHMLRCFPSNELIEKECGISPATHRKHRDKLIEMKAIVQVPYEKRLTELEKSLHVRKHVYQLTGIMQLKDGRIIPTVYINSQEALAQHVSILSALGFDTSLILKVHGKLSKIDSLKSEKTNSLKRTSKLSKIDTKVVQVVSNTGEVKTPTPVVVSDEPITTPDISHGLITAWHSEANHGSEMVEILNMPKYRDTAMKLHEDLQTTPDEVRACTKEQAAKPRKGAYLFWYLLQDIPEYRERHKHDIAAQGLEKSVQKSASETALMYAELMGVQDDQPTAA